MRRIGPPPAPEVAGAARRGHHLMVLWLLLLGLLLSANLTSFFLYRSVRSQLDQQLGARLLSIATTAAEAIGAERFAALAADSTGPRTDVGLAGELARIASTNELDNVILLDAGERCVLDLRGGVAAGERHPLLELEPELAATLVTGVPQTTRLVQIEGLSGEYLKTGFAPFEDDSGRVVGGIAVEGGSDFFRVLPTMRAQLVTSTALAGAAALVLGWLVLRNLRALVRLEEQLRRSAALVAIGQLSAVVAHEIRNPLAIIRSRAERVRAKITQGRAPEEILDWFDAIPREVDRLNGILTNYLALARPDQLASGECVASSVFEETLALLAPEFASRSIRIRREDETGLSVGMGARPLQQALLNLLLNAMEAMPGGGEITLRARKARGGAVLEVEDTGPGMTDEQRERALEPFYTTKATGSGLGLTLVKSLLESAGGTLAFESAPAGGTVVRLWIPDPGRKRR